LLLYRPALSGPFLSDDHHYVMDNAFVHDLSFAARCASSIRPRTRPSRFNYAPVQMLLHAAALRVFGEDPTGHHVVNVLLHALASALLAALFVRAGLSRPVSAGAALLFLLHPANVEAVAWISQAKTPLSFVLSMGALLAQRRRPALGTLLFGLALLAKPAAAFALPVAALLDWTRKGRVRWRWLALWGVLLGGYAVIEIVSHSATRATPRCEATRRRSGCARWWRSRCVTW
jgi:hypothetical protein